ncbi:bifunctional glutamate N-acetyltransferase/amino-acid acetyltransferase ArgJ [Jannaschia pohangensis]|uniref:Arginine biosynthesis bifunctional protein ArgJ n=1 Tax=Jannaschia pohangensis TaxID=390807 RepID=A0A1I3T6A9_9RHOB|nr:bifunctional glutamate N-acetyltransferase/amino-acid acetyltransferase ArgJ [Jannaschia pohangensis]SFJ66113.1 glutamate N-acetyltransferase [Jannaschia pohangensis]
MGKGGKDKKAKGPKKKDLKARIKGLEAQVNGPKGPLVSPLAPPFPDLPAIDGIRFSTGAAGVKYKNRTDVMLAEIAPGSAVAGVFTTSATRSAAVLDCQAKLAKRAASGGWAILVNSGNSNAFTGKVGVTSVDAVCAATSQALGIPASRVLTSSTGVIGEPMKHERIVEAVDTIAAGLTPDGMGDAARAIMTTDTFPKGATTTVEIEGKTITIAGIAKGSGMIAPDMATMLAYVFTDAAVTDRALQTMLSEITRETFNAVTVDSDTSTSDTLIVAATGRAGNEPIKSSRSPEGAAFREAFHSVLHDLALQLVMDGEGATKLVEVQVTGAANALDARRVASAIANSPLVKTAIAGADANWGRVVMAVGKSGARADRDKLSIRFGDIVVARDGMRAPDYSEEATSAYMTRARIEIGVDLGMGEASDTMWTCDLTYRYIEINADYRS